MSQTVVIANNRHIVLPPRLAAIVEVLLAYREVICTPDRCEVQLSCGRTGTGGRRGTVTARLVMPLERPGEAQDDYRP
jgi:hypothetical protein